ncbi:hypothetical protein [Amycolatopsis sp. NPDC059021]|uniref:hypothetical protein n=1 Tax=Amycolatopsis sp. NPDC059021 TaxID=3346704 RepID=UPI00366F9470
MSSAIALRVVALSCSLVLAVGGGQASAARQATAGGAVDPDRTVYPLDAFELTEPELQVAGGARYLLTRECVHRFGAGLPARHQGRLGASRADRYGLADEVTARTWAYSLDAPPRTTPPWELEIDSRSSLYPIVNGVDADGHPARLTGLPDGGCRAAANRVLERDTGAVGKSPVPELDRRAWQASRQDPAVREAADGWKRCMAGAGLGYADPVEAPYFHWFAKRMAANPRPSEEQRRDGIRPTGEERRAALEDVRCKRDSGFLVVWVAADQAAQRNLVVAERERLTAYRHALDRLVHNATQVLAAGDAAAAGN